MTKKIIQTLNQNCNSPIHFLFAQCLIYSIVHLIYTIYVGNLNIYILADRWSRTNPNFAQTQTLNKPKVRTNLNFEQTQTSNKPKSFWP